MARGINYCSFCGKGQPDVRHLLLAKSGVFICNECVEICSEIVEESRLGCDIARRDSVIHVDGSDRFIEKGAVAVGGRFEVLPGNGERSERL